MTFSAALFRAESFFGTAARRLLSFLCERYTCVYCGAPVVSSVVCDSCAAEKLLVWTPTFSEAGRRLRCRVCGIELLSERDVCMRCRETPLLAHTERVFPVHTYVLRKKDLLVLWKIRGVRQLSALFAEVVAGVLSTELCDGAVLPIVPVPPRPGKIRKCGWDQIADLCRFLKLKYGFPILPLLERRSAEQQKTLNRSQRLLNLGKSYAADARALRRCKSVPEAVVLLDDILTTGVTLETCAAVLQSVGVKRVFACTLFIVD
ncbi:ComF family protein [Treponema brennaborense]|uniref:Phosphoribosyltransferase n=1 Tax=Treponema brennaborense (strain DSM 12168 / CIP 105900 / DD5/3) TaxID=906968 RepID=F4LPK8_TREBD|nr:ComF family protein [Treponema brennaborense]AEE17004.1 phosphoribosyltransferase [Treponema brennaborense DSM 12168]